MGRFLAVTRGGGSGLYAPGCATVSAMDVWVAGVYRVCFAEHDFPKALDKVRAIAEERGWQWDGYREYYEAGTTPRITGAPRRRGDLSKPSRVGRPDRVSRAAQPHFLRNYSTSKNSNEGLRGY